MSVYKDKLKTTSNYEKLVPNLISLQRQLKDNLKFTITEYANNARNEINKNTKIKEYISRLKYINELFKKLLTDIMKNKGTKKEIYNLLITNNDIFKEDNKVLKGEIKEELKKLNKYQNILNKELKPLKEEINRLKDLNFILDNKIICYNNIITRREYILFMAENCLKQNTQLELVISGDLNSFDDFLIDISKLYQQTLLLSIKELNKIKNKNTEKLMKIKKLKKMKNGKGKIIDIDIEDNDKEKIEESNINNVENSIENSVLSFKEFEILRSLSTLENIEKNIENEGIIINKNIYNLPQKNLIKSNLVKPITSRGINKFNNNINIKNKRISSLENKIIHKNTNEIINSNNLFELPKLNLKQINFNKDNKNGFFSTNRIRNNDRTLSKSTKRNVKYNNPETIIKQKVKIKEKIKLMEKNIMKNKELINEFKEYYNKIMNKYDKYIYQPDIESYVLSLQTKFDDEN